MNFGPNFKHPIEDNRFKARPVNYFHLIWINFSLTFKIIILKKFKISDLATEKFIEHSLSDLVYHVTHDEVNNEK
jgi:hypothetical protein